MRTPQQCLVVVVIAALSVLSVASPVAAAGPHHEKAEPVSVMNKSSNPVPVSVQGTVPVTIVGGAAGGGSSTAPAPEDAAQFTNEGVNFASISAAELFAARPGKRFVMDFVTITAALPSADCSLALVRVYDGGKEYTRTVMPLQGNAAGLFGASQAVKMLVDSSASPAQRIDAFVFPANGCNSSDLRLSVVGHFVER